LIGSGLARRYVQPLFEVAREKDRLEQVQSELALLDRCLSESPELRGFLSNPSIERRAKWGVAQQIFTGATPYTLNFMRVVIDKNRTRVLDVACRLFDEMLNLHRGVTPGVVETAVPLDETAFAEVRSNLERRFGGELELEQRVEPTLLGGLRVRVGNTVIDGSVRGSLNRLKQAIAGA